VTVFLNKLKINPADFKRISVIAIVLVNLVPIYGVLFMGWQVFPVMLLFWIENVIIGVSNVLKMLLASPGNVGQWVAKVFMIPFFCVHYGIFTLVHGIFVLILFGGFYKTGTPSPGISDILGIIAYAQLGWAVLALVISHTISFVTNYIGQGEYKQANLSELMAQPYGRVVILHLTILLGGFTVMSVGSPEIGLVLLIALKTFVDIKAHLKQHNSAVSDKSGTVVLTN
jgi:hypothetical protein